MPDYSLTFARAARKEIEALDAAVVQRIFPKIEGLIKDPRPKGAKKLRGEKYAWRIRVGDYRVIYELHDDKRVVDIVAVRHRSAAYD